jgi:hypothetical protein
MSKYYIDYYKLKTKFGAANIYAGLFPLIGFYAFISGTAYQFYTITSLILFTYVLIGLLSIFSSINKVE